MIIEKKEDSLDSVTLMRNRVLVLPNPENDHINIGGERMFLDTSFEKEKHAISSGTVVKTAPLYYSHKDPESLDYDVEMELREGDTVIFHFNALARAQKNGYTIYIGGTKYYSLPYGSLFVARRDGDIIPLNGYVFVSPVKEEVVMPEGLIAPDMVKDLVSMTKGVVAHKGCLVNDYRMYDGYGDVEEVEIGDIVCFRKTEAVLVEYDMHSDLPPLYRIHRKNILAVIS
jgi:co-chaperonin GroES (HSP10)